MAKRLMIQGTMSGVGKSLLTAALCRIFTQDGYRVAPFKSQNMALNSYITRDGFEMGRAQVLQALACNKEPDVRMNPVLLKPSSDVGSQVIVHGTSIGNYKARDYFAMKKTLIPRILADYHSLESENDIIVIEGAGSPAEINLKSDDIVNMGFAKLVNAPVALVGDIDPGGVFAQLYGTAALLEKEERERIIGTVINKFRGDPEILRPGLEMLEEKMGIPCLGVVPYVKLDLDDEDSMSGRLGQKEAKRPIDIAVIRLPHISNFTDFSPLEQHETLGVRYVSAYKELGEPDLIILPGSKSTMDDLLTIRENGLEAMIQKLAARGVPVLGICGGYQMLGESIEDPYGVENDGTKNGRESMKGMGLLPVRTVFTKEKTRTRVNAKTMTTPFEGICFDAYEIHMGETVRLGGSAFSIIDEEKEDGCVFGNVTGTYLHGLFDSTEMIEALAKYLCGRKGLEYKAGNLLNHDEQQRAGLDRLADTVRKNLDITALYKAMEAYEHG